MQNYWIVPCNPKVFDVEQHFRLHNKVVWKNISKVRPGDIVYIYLGAPYKELCYKCVVLTENVTDSVLEENNYAKAPRPMSELYVVDIKYMELRLLHTLPRERLGFQILKAHGLGQVQVQAKVPDQLVAFIESEIKQANRNMES